MGLTDDEPTTSSVSKAETDISLINAQECVGSSVSRARISAQYSACDQRSYADVVRHVRWNVNHTTSTQEAD